MCVNYRGRGRVDEFCGSEMINELFLDLRTSRQSCMKQYTCNNMAAWAMNC
jgi:hypothetical protein